MALVVCILTNRTPEESFQLIAPVRKPRGKNISLMDDVIEEMVRLKETMSYEALGKHYGVSVNTVYRKIKKYRERTVEADGSTEGSKNRYTCC